MIRHFLRQRTICNLETRRPPHRTSSTRRKGSWNGRSDLQARQYGDKVSNVRGTCHQPSSHCTSTKGRRSLCNGGCRSTCSRYGSGRYFRNCIGVLEVLRLTSFHIPSIRNRAVCLLTRFLRPFFLIRCTKDRLTFYTLVAEDMLNPCSIGYVGRHVRVLFLLLRRLGFLPYVNQARVTGNIVSNIVIRRRARVAFFLDFVTSMRRLYRLLFDSACLVNVIPHVTSAIRRDCVNRRD